MKRKKILIVDLGGVMGGVEYYVETLSEILRERATLVSLCVLPELAQQLRSLGVKVFLIPAFTRLQSSSIPGCVLFASYHHPSRTSANRPGQWFFGIGSLDTRTLVGAQSHLRPARPV